MVTLMLMITILTFARPKLQKPPTDGSDHTNPSHSSQQTRLTFLVSRRHLFLLSVSTNKSFSLSLSFLPAKRSVALLLKRHPTRHHFRDPVIVPCCYQRLKIRKGSKGCPSTPLHLLVPVLQLLLFVLFFFYLKLHLARNDSSPY